jgi:hypothetical protein
MAPNPLSVLLGELGSSEDDPKALWVLAAEVWKLRERERENTLLLTELSRVIRRHELLWKVVEKHGLTREALDDLNRDREGAGRTEEFVRTSADRKAP